MVWSNTDDIYPGLVQVPHVAVVGLVIRDLLVCLIVLPAALGNQQN